MAPKKRALKDDSTSSSGEFDPSKFMNQEASKLYTKLVSLKFIREIGFVKPNGILRREIALKRWIELCKHPEYGEIFVQGKWVPFDRKVINAYYNLEEGYYELF